MSSWLACDALPDDVLTDFQISEKGRLRQLATRVLDHMTGAFPNEAAWSMTKKAWNGDVSVAIDPYAAAYEPGRGCLVVWIPTTRTGQYREDTANARVLLALSKGATNNARCSSLHSAMLVEATRVLKIPVALDCSVAQGAGLNRVESCSECTWLDGAPYRCHALRHVWPEFVGASAREVDRFFRNNGYAVRLATWDSMYHQPSSSSDDDVRIVYDARSGLVVVAPYLGSLNPPAKDWQCFRGTDPQSAIGCVGAPLAPPPAEWRKYVGGRIQDVNDSLRARFPHAVVELLPDTATVGPERRSDRIRVRFDADSGRVVAVPTLG